MIALPVLLACVHAPNEVGDQVGELLLVALGKLMKDRHRNWGNRVLCNGWMTLSARHGFPPWPAWVAAPGVLEEE
jgi:hypothetical protein